MILLLLAALYAVESASTRSSPKPPKYVERFNEPSNPAIGLLIAATNPSRRPPGAVCHAFFKGKSGESIDPPKAAAPELATTRIRSSPLPPKYERIEGCA